MATALISALTQRPVSRDVAMTGEITLRGRVLPIGGLKEKSLAAFRAGIRTIIVPDRNEKDLEEIPKVLRRKLKLVIAKNMSDVLKVALMEREKTKGKRAAASDKKSLEPRRKKISRRSDKPLHRRHRERILPIRP